MSQDIRPAGVPLKEKSLISRMADSRVPVSRTVGVLVVLLATFTGHSFGQDTLIDISLEMSGLFLLTVCSVGRLWALVFIAGFKRRELITDGPYSMVRNPLYLFSFLGAVGIGLASENILVLAVLIAFYLFYYPFTIFAEEKILSEKFGQAYADYANRTPRFVPKLSLYKRSGPYQINTETFVRNLVGGMWFVWIFILFHLIEMLQNAGVVPVFLRVP